MIKMDFKKQFGEKIAALLLLIALILPTAMQFSHIFESHEHITCNEVSTHMHQNIIDCSVCDYHLASFNNNIPEYPDLEISIIPVKIKEDFSSLLFHSFKITNTQLRAPPIFS